MCKNKAMRDSHETKKWSYDKLRWYCHVVKEINSGSYAEREIDLLTNIFKQFCICFHVCFVGFVCDC